MEKGGQVCGKKHNNLTAEGVVWTDTHLPPSVFQMPFAFYKQEMEVQRGQAPCATTQSKLEAGLECGPGLFHPPPSMALLLASFHPSGEPWLLHLRLGQLFFMDAPNSPDCPLMPF